MGIIITAFTLFGMVALVLLSEAMEEPTKHRTTRSLPNANEAVSNPRQSKKAA